VLLLEKVGSMAGQGLVVPSQRTACSSSFKVYGRYSSGGRTFEWGAFGELLVARSVPHVHYTV